MFAESHASTAAHVTQPCSYQYSNACFAAVAAAGHAPVAQLCESHFARALGGAQASLQSDAAWCGTVANDGAQTAANPARGVVEVDAAAYENVCPWKVAAPHPLQV